MLNSRLLMIICPEKYLLGGIYVYIIKLARKGFESWFEVIALCTLFLKGFMIKVI